MNCRTVHRAARCEGGAGEECGSVRQPLPLTASVALRRSYPPTPHESSTRHRFFLAIISAQDANILTYTRSQIIQDPSVLALTAWVLSQLIWIAETGPLWSFIIAPKSWWVGYRSHTRTCNQFWKRVSTLKGVFKPVLCSWGFGIQHGSTKHWLTWAHV